MVRIRLQEIITAGVLVGNGSRDTGRQPLCLLALENVTCLSR